MKKFLSIFFVAVTLFAQSVTVVKVEKVNLNGSFYYPKFSPDDEHLLLTQENYKGLYLVGLKNNGIKILSEENGAGFKAKFAGDGERVFFRSFKLIEGRKFSSQKIFDLLENKEVTVLSNKRDLTPPIKTYDGEIFCFLKGEKQVLAKSLMKTSDNERSVFIRNSLIVFREGEDEKVLMPFGKGIYVWPSLSPDGNSILFTFGSKGSFIMDTNGNVISELGEIHYPRFSPDGKWVVGMNDKDDGYKFTSSDIVLINLKTLRKFNITNTKEKIEMYPEWSHKGNEVTFNDLDGNIYIVKLILAEG